MCRHQLYLPSMIGQGVWTMVECKQRPLYTLRKINQLLKGKEGRGGQAIGSPLPIHFRGVFRSKNAMRIYWNSKSLGSLFYHQHEVILNGQTTTLSVILVKMKNSNTICDNGAQNTLILEMQYIDSVTTC